jgi:hypothetical protein
MGHGSLLERVENWTGSFLKLRESRIVRRPKTSVNEGCCEKAVYAL